MNDHLERPARPETSHPIGTSPLKSTRRRFLQHSLAVAAVAPLASAGQLVAQTARPTALVVIPRSPLNNLPTMAEADGTLRFSWDEERLILAGGLQPSMLCTKSGVFIIQGQLPEKPVETPRMHYPSALGTVVSRDGAKTWERIPLKAGDNGVNLEGGITQLRDGTIVALDTYLTPGKAKGKAEGHLYLSKDDWRTVEGPIVADFGVADAIYPSKDDGGRPHEAMRLHRRILELPNGDLVTTYYGWLTGDSTPSTYEPRMIKTRVKLARSTDRGRSWNYVSTIAVDPRVGTEGFGEPTLARISQGPQAGRLLCMMRTGRELYEATSDDNGATWSKPAIRTFAGLDINRTELWVDMFRHLKGKGGKMLDESNRDDLPGAVVDPDLIELRSGLLVASFGVRVTQKACWLEPRHPWNGSYLAVSQDHGKTWPNVMRLTTGVQTTHYTAIEETPTANRIFVAYDLGGWSRGIGRDLVGRHIDIAVKG